MSTPAKEAPKDQPDEEARDLPPDPAGSESPEAEEEEGEGECGFCLFMKGGGCRDAFTEWEKCVQEAETNNEDLLEKCAPITAALKQCMDAHSSYYEPILRAEKLAEEQAIVELEKEKLVSREDQKTDHVVEEVATIELLKENQNLTPNESQAPPPSSQDPNFTAIIVVGNCGCIEAKNLNDAVEIAVANLYLKSVSELLQKKDKGAFKKVEVENFTFNLKKKNYLFYSQRSLFNRNS